MCMYIYIFFYISDCQCQTIKVSLSNEVLSKQASRQGVYQKSATVNGKPSWESTTQAIWYEPYYRKWAIGELSNIGTALRGIASAGREGGEYACPIEVPKNKWLYDYVDWQEIKEGDVLFECQDSGKKAF